MTSTRVKICGITRPADADFAAQAGADAIGIVFYPRSARYVADLALAREIAQSAGPLVTVVGLFVDAETQWIEKVLTAVPLNLLQFHGDESPSICASYQRPFIKAIRMQEGLDLQQKFSDYAHASGFLLDTYVQGEPGGTGQCFNWLRFPKDCEKHVILAGGLTPENVIAAVSATQAYAVDVSGGVELRPGIKDHDKILSFITKAKTGAIK